MDTILTDILFALARAGVATFLARELYVVTVPAMLVFSLTVYAIITRDPLRTSLPPYIGFRGLWRVLHGRKRVLGRRQVARLSVFGRDAFWVSEAVLNELIYSKQMVQVFQGKGIFMEYTDKEKMAVENVSSYTNLAMFPDVVDEEGVRFIETVSKAHGIGLSVIREFVTRTLLRIAYGIGPTEKSPFKISQRRSITALLIFHFFPFLSRRHTKAKPSKSETIQNRNAIDNPLCLENLLFKQTVKDPVLLAQYVVNTSSPLITGALHQTLIGLLSNYKIAREAQSELDVLYSKPKITSRDLESLSILRAIVTESMRLGISTAAPDVWYRSRTDLWYKKWFIPKNSIVILDRQIPLTNPVFLDKQFRPEKFLTNKDLREYVEDVAFGYGPPGESLVKRILVTTVAMVLRKFTIARGKSDGKVKYIYSTIRT